MISPGIGKPRVRSENTIHPGIIGRTILPPGRFPGPTPLLTYSHMTDPALNRLAEAARERRAALMADLAARPDGRGWGRRHTAIMDALWAGIYERALLQTPDAPAIPGFAVVATGGYGRAELAPFSDLDVAIVPVGESAGQEEVVKWLFRAAHHAIGRLLGLRIQYVYRLPHDVAGLDPVSLSGLLDARLVAGSPEAFARLQEALATDFPTLEFLRAKQDERRRDLRRTHATPLVTEPELKLGAGGLRDYQAAQWINQILGYPREIPAEVEAAHEGLHTVRNLLHQVANQHLDTLNLGRREELARLLGKTPGQLGGQVAQWMLTLQTYALSVQRRITQSDGLLGPGFRAQGGLITWNPGMAIERVAVAVDHAAQLGLAPDPHAPEPVGDGGPELVNALGGGQATLKTWDAMGLLPRLLPELAACRTLMPEDASHLYTVFEHTRVVIRNLESIDARHPLAEIRDQVDDWGLLILAAALHDVGKIDRSRPHDQVGAAMAAEVARRWRVEDGRRDLLVWLVQNHLAMSRFIRLRDVMNAETAFEFARLVETEERLHALTLLTWADVNAVNPALWTPVQETFLRELHARTQTLLVHPTEEGPDAEVARRRLWTRLRKEEVAEAELEAFVAGLPAHYLLSTDAETVRDHLLLARQARAESPQFLTRDLPDLRVTDFTVCCPDAPGLLTRILGVLYAYDISLLGVRACTSLRPDEPALALDTFTINWRGDCVPDRVMAKIRSALREVLNGQADLDALMRREGKDPTRPQHVLTVHVVKGDPAIVEVRGPRGRGLMYRLARVLAETELDILAARSGLWAGQGSVAFYVRPRGDEEMDAALDRLETRLSAGG